MLLQSQGHVRRQNPAAAEREDQPRDARRQVWVKIPRPKFWVAPPALWYGRASGSTNLAEERV
jgi:hypothetical protein